MHGILIDAEQKRGCKINAFLLTSNVNYAPCLLSVTLGATGGLIVILLCVRLCVTD